MMKTYTLLSLALLISLLACAQDTKKFTYELIRNNRYIVTPKFEQRRDKIDPKGEFISVFPDIKDKKWFSKTINDVIKSAIESDKWNKLLDSEHRSRLNITFCPSGKLYKLRFFLQKEDLNILSEDDLYVIYKAFDDSTIDMSKIELEYPNNFKNKNKSCWFMSCPLPAKDIR